MVSHVSMPFRFEYERPFQVASDIGEVWSLYVHRLNDGLVILGARAGTAPADIAQRFVANAARFGNQLGDALSTPERAIDEVFHYAVIDASGSLRWAIGGIPLKTAPPEVPDRATPAPVRDIDGDLYSGFIEPVTSRSGRKVGMISAFEDVTGEQKVLHSPRSSMGLSQRSCGASPWCSRLFILGGFGWPTFRARRFHLWRKVTPLNSNLHSDGTTSSRERIRT
jgi:hypothetical protein